MMTQSRKWFALGSGGKSVGPFDDERLLALAGEGRITARSKIKADDGPWIAAAELEWLFPTAVTATSTPPAWGMDDAGPAPEPDEPADDSGPITFAEAERAAREEPSVVAPKTKRRGFLPRTPDHGLLWFGAMICGIVGVICLVVPFGVVALGLLGAGSANGIVGGIASLFLTVPIALFIALPGAVLIMLAGLADLAIQVAGDVRTMRNLAAESAGHAA